MEHSMTVKAGLESAKTADQGNKKSGMSLSGTHKRPVL
jgi:hypothetical protein